MIKKWLTDKEKSILFSALTREKEICKEIYDKKTYREPYEDSLVSVIESLEYKFYYDRLFKQMEKEIYIKAIEDFAEKIKDRVPFRVDDGEYSDGFNNCSKKVLDRIDAELAKKKWKKVKAGGNDG